MMKRFSVYLLSSVIIVTTAALLAVFYTADNDTYPFSLGLDLAGGAQLTYTADTSKIPSQEIPGRMSSLQTVIERRVNALGVSEPRIYTATSSIVSGFSRDHRLIVELPGVTDIQEAIRSIVETPYLEFRIFNQEQETFDSIGLQGGNVKSASVQFLQGVGGALTNEPVVLLHFDSDGAGIFADVTRANIGNLLGIFLDGVAISTPVIQSAILGGTTQITGDFTIESATELADDLNFGALPLPISLSETRTVNPTLGIDTVSASFYVGLIALFAIMLLFLLVYRIAGFVAALALIVYCSLVLALFKAIPIVLTAAGLAGFIMSIGFAVDANVLIFERMREGVRNGLSLPDAIEEGCARAWMAIRDANITSIIIAALLFWFGTSLIKGFAFAFILGVLVSMLSAYLFTRVFLRTTAPKEGARAPKWYIR